MRIRRLMASIMSAFLMLSVMVGPAPAASSRNDGLRPGDLVRDHALGAFVPDRGNEVWVHALLDDGTMQSLGIVSAEDGNITVLDQGDETSTDSSDPAAAETTTALAALGECSDDHYQLNGYKWTVNYNWYYKYNETPSYLDGTTTLGNVKNGTYNITQVNNNCGRADAVSATNSYAGSTTQYTDMDHNGNCSPNGTSVTAFGTLPSGILALTCTSSSSGIAIASDLKFNKGVYSFTNDPGSSCSNKFDVRSVTTHERGHTFGLSDLYNSDHANLTMYGTITSCDIKARTLGLGDMKGLESLY